MVVPSRSAGPGSHEEWLAQVFGPSASLSKASVRPFLSQIALSPSLWLGKGRGL
jgi:hypothetical protein